MPCPFEAMVMTLHKSSYDGESKCHPQSCQMAMEGHKKHHSLHRHLETLARIALFGKAAIAAAEQFTREISCRKDDLQFQRILIRAFIGFGR